MNFLKKTVANFSSEDSPKISLGVIISTGFAMFSMFFGAGNLIFPLMMGALVDQEYPFAIVGFILTGVIVPFMGLIATVMAKGNYENFFAVLGKRGSVIVPFILMLLIGPLGATPRVISVGYGSLSSMFPSLNVYAYAIVAGVIVYYFVYDQSKLVDRVGKILTPFLLVSLTALLIFGYYDAGFNTDSVVVPTATESFFIGITNGYQTMDLLATFFFAVIIIRHIKDKLGEECGEKSINKMTVKAMIIGVACLGVVYYGFTYLGATYSDFVRGQPGDIALSIVAHKALGSYGGIILSLTFILACLTTAVALVVSFAEFIHHVILREKISYNICLIFTIALSCALSTLKFSGILVYLSPIVQAIYPGIIFITGAYLIRPIYDFPYTKQFFYVISVLGGIYVAFS